VTGRPTRPVEAYPPADPTELPPPPPPGAEGEAAAIAASPASAKAAERPRAEVASLRFLDPGALSRAVPLAHPFEHEGGVVDVVTVRRLTVAEVGAVMERYGADDQIELFDFYAAMSGLPAAVLRGLIDDDGAEVVAAARPLLPRLATALFFPSISEAGAATPSAPSVP
jgi:hypothetical protein